MGLHERLENYFRRVNTSSALTGLEEIANAPLSKRAFVSALVGGLLSAFQVFSADAKKKGRRKKNGSKKGRKNGRKKGPNKGPNKGRRKSGRGSKAQIWFQDNNLGGSGRVQPDASRMFSDAGLKQWARLRSRMDVYMFRVNYLTGLSDEELARIIEVLKRFNIKIALNAVGATLTCGDRKQLMYREADLIRRIERLGGRVSYLALQSALSKDSVTGCRGMSTGKKISSIVRYFQYMKKQFPGIRIGLYDASATKQGGAYKRTYVILARALKRRRYRLDFAILDMPFESAGPKYDKAIEAEKWGKRKLRGTTFGLTMTSSGGGRASGNAFHKKVVKGSKTYRRAGGKAKIILITAWYRNPRRLLPEVGKANTLTKTALSVTRNV